MATTFKTFLNNDIVSSRTLLHEAIPITGTIVSGTYDALAAGGPQNVKNYSHKMFSSVYDYPYLSSSANHILDITMGYSAASKLSHSAPDTDGSSTDQQKKKINIYNEMAQVLVGYDVSGNIQQFDADGNILGGGTKLDACFFINFARLLTKDEVKKGSFNISFVTGGTPAVRAGGALVISDTNAETNYKVNSPAGEYGILKVSSVPSGEGHTVGDSVGLLYYQAGIAVLSSSVFYSVGTTDAGNDERPSMSNFAHNNSALSTGTVAQTMFTQSIQVNADAIRTQLHNISFNNTTELNSSIYFCRANHNDFNYSTNPTYLNSSKIVVKNNTLENPVTYATTIGLYSADNELLAVAKLSEPIKKDPTNELTFRVRLDY